MHRFVHLYLCMYMHVCVHVCMYIYMLCFYTCSVLFKHLFDDDEEMNEAVFFFNLQGTKIAHASKLYISKSQYLNTPQGRLSRVGQVGI